MTLARRGFLRFAAAAVAAPATGRLASAQTPDVGTYLEAAQGLIARHERAA